MLARCGCDRMPHDQMPNHLPRNRSKFLSAGLKTAASFRYSRLRPPISPPPAVFAACSQCSVGQWQAQPQHPGTDYLGHQPELQHRVMPHMKFSDSAENHPPSVHTCSQSSSDRKTAELSLSVNRGSPFRTSVKCGSWVPKPMPSTAIAPCSHVEIESDSANGCVQ